MLQPLLLWNYFSPATVQQSWLLFDQALRGLGKKNKSPFSCAELGMGMGKGCNGCLAPLLWGQPRSHPQPGILVLACG